MTGHLKNWTDIDTNHKKKDKLVLKEHYRYINASLSFSNIILLVSFHAVMTVTHPKTDPQRQLSHNWGFPRIQLL